MAIISNSCILSVGGVFNPRVGHKSTLFIHVGKTGGTTANHQLHANGIKTDQLHVHPVHLAMVRHYKYIIISVRDPLERYVSSFNNFMPEGENPLQYLYECYSNISFAADAILDSTKCAFLLRTTDSHLRKGFCYYLGGRAVRNALRLHKNVYIVRQEFFDADMALVMEKLGDRRPPYNKVQSIHIRAPQSRYMTPRGKTMLRGYLEAKGEYDVYRELVQFLLHS
jgi:hypothetical protein